MERWGEWVWRHIGLWGRPGVVTSFFQQRLRQGHFGGGRGRTEVARRAGLGEDMRTLTPTHVEADLSFILEPQGATGFIPPVSGFGHTPGFFFPSGGRNA